MKGVGIKPRNGRRARLGFFGGNFKSDSFFLGFGIWDLLIFKTELAV